MGHYYSYHYRHYHITALLVRCLTLVHATTFPFACGVKPILRFVLNITDKVLRSYELSGLV